MVWKALGVLGTVLVLSSSTKALVAQGLDEADADSSRAERPLPAEWFVEHTQFLTQQGGRWVTDNFAYESENEPFDAYGLEWKPGLGGKTLTGRLFGLQDGKDAGTFWEFRIVWHPGEGRAYVHQFGGDGTFGVGTMEPVAEGKVRIVQDFFHPDGSRSRLAHDSTHGPGEWIHDQSYDIAEDGAWEERRSYDWKLTPAAD
jgi:hypothetical protein